MVPVVLMVPLVLMAPPVLMVPLVLIVFTGSNGSIDSYSSTGSNGSKNSSTLPIYTTDLYNWSASSCDFCCLNEYYNELMA